MVGKKIAFAGAIIGLAMALSLAPQLRAGETGAAEVQDLIAARQGGMVMSVFTLARLSAAATDDKPLTGAAFPAGGLATFARSLPTLFAPGTRSSSGHSKALPSVWDDADGFAARIADYQAATGELEAAAKADDRAAFTAALAKTKAACKACHDSYRAEVQ